MGALYMQEVQSWKCSKPIGYERCYVIQLSVMTYDYAVIGKGLFGSAAARYLSQHGSTLVIGPDEPQNTETHRGIFASHYDQGRLTREIASDAVWAELAKRSMNVYKDIEQASGIKFHNPVGCVYIASEAGIAPYKQIAADRNVAYNWHEEAKTLQEQHPYFGAFEGCSVIAEPKPAGYINPRELIQAQLEIAKQQGATILPETVISVETLKSVCKVTANETTHRAKKVLLTTGAYTNGFNLIEEKLELRVKSETILYAQVSAGEAERLKDMPSVIFDKAYKYLDDFYLLPPILYPDGKYYVKLGGNTAADVSLVTSREMGDWMRKGKSNMFKENFQETLKDMLPDLKIEALQTGRCLVTYTNHRKPYIDGLVNNRLYVATGGNGSGAKSSDAIGHLAANLVKTGKWKDDLPQELFKAKLAKS